MREDYRWHRARPSPRRRPRRQSSSPLTAVFSVGILIGLAAADLTAPQTASRDAVSGGPSAASFDLCYTGGGWNCVVDGDTFWMNGEKIRVADIDAPETHPGRCAEEQELGDRATARLRTLLNAGSVTLRPIDRDEDRYGRKLRIVVRNGRSIGDTLINEGLARPWTGRRQPWCGFI